MKSTWNLCGLHLHRILFLLFLVLHLQCHPCSSLNLEGLALLAFRSKVDVDPHGALTNWNPRDGDPCSWAGVRCIDGKVETLNLKGLSLGGTLAPELAKLSHLRSLVLHKNNFSGVIPKEIGELTMLELLDLRGNNLSGSIPAELGEMITLGHLLLCDDEFQDSKPLIGSLNSLSELKCGQTLHFPVATGLGCRNRKLGHCIQGSGLRDMKEPNSHLIPIRGEVSHFVHMFSWFKFKKNFPSNSYDEKHGTNIPIFSESNSEDNMQHSATSARRTLLEVSNNLPAEPTKGSIPQKVVDVPSVGSGSFPAVPNPIVGPLPASVSPASSKAASSVSPASSKAVDSAQNHSSFIGGLGKIVIFIVIGVTILIALVAGSLACRQQSASTVGPWRTGLSGQLQKALVAGVPKLNRSELEAACEDFSNIVISFPNCTVFKGILSSGVEISVLSTVLTAKDWSKRSQTHFRRKIDILSRVNHKNFINLLGYCEENEPFTRMLVFEYGANGSLFELLHGKEYEYLDWNSRMRIIMGVAYCLEYMHHELNPPVATANLQSNLIYMTDDNAAKLCDAGIWEELVARRNKSFEEDIDPSDSPCDDPAGNVYTFGLLMLEIISGKLQHSQEGVSIRNWAADYLNEKHDFKNLVDPSVKSFKDDELEVICEVIRECINGDAKHRPTMREITSKLKEVIQISPEAASPRLSPLWWAELEILSVEAS